MKEQLQKLQEEVTGIIKHITSLKYLQDLQEKYLGRKGSITEVLRGMGKLSKEERPVIGELANKVRGTIQSAIDEKKEALEQIALEKQLETETIDVTLPGRPVHTGGTHIL